MNVDSLDFERWYRTYHPKLIAALVIVAGSQSAAGDAADEALARALEQWSRVSQMASTEGWVYRVGVNVLRRQRWRHQREAAAAARVHDPSPARTLAPGVWEAVRALPARQREAIVLRYVLDLGEAETADAMGVAVGTASATLHAARRRLAVLLNDDITIEVP
jgi:RNA polymerase sigma factor (sigma-70 family)